MVKTCPFCGKAGTDTSKDDVPVHAECWSNAYKTLGYQKAKMVLEKYEP